MKRPPNGFGTPKLKAPKSAKTELRKLLRAIRRKNNVSKGFLQEVRRIEANNPETKDNPGSSGIVHASSSVADGTEGTADDQGYAVRIDSNGEIGAEARSSSCGFRNVIPVHGEEWLNSCVDPDIIDLNVRSLSGNTPYDYLCYSDKLPRLNTGALNRFWMQRYAHTYKGGWWCSGVDVLTGEDSQWGCFKSDEKHTDDEGKTVKYEHPPKVATEIFALKIPHRLWELIARRYDVALPEKYQDLPHGAFWQWIINHPQIPVIITEGCKKSAAVLSCGYVCIAVPGINSAYRQPKDEFGESQGLASLIPQLQVFAQKGRRIYFCYDQDSKRTTTRAVNHAIAKTGKLFTFQGCEVNVISWHPTMGKGIDDVLASLGRGTFDELYCNAASFDNWQSKQLRQLSYTPDLVINQRYIGEIVPPSAQLIAVKAPKGSGKTEWLRFLSDARLRSGEGRVLLITHRIQLSLQGAERLGLPYITDLRSTEQGSLFGYGCCIDSIHPESQAHFNPSEWRGAWVVIDEVMQVIWHLLTSPTCVQNRVMIVKTLQELLRTVVATGGKIFIMDADLSDVAIDFIEGLLGFSPERFILVNEYVFNEPWTIHKFGGKNPAQLIGALEKRLERGEKALLSVSGQRTKSSWGTQVAEEYFRRKFPHLKILRIDSETVANPEHEAYRTTKNINEIVPLYDLVVASPTIETGISIDVDHFNGVWFIGQGVQTCDGVRQNLSRVRPPVPRYVWIKPQGISFIGNKATTPSGLISGQRRADKWNRAKLLESGLEQMPDGSFSPISIETWAKLASVINMGMYHYEETILHDLQQEGHIVVDWCGDEEIASDTIKKEVTSVRDELYTRHRDDVAAADRLTDTEFEKLSKQQERRTSELLQFRKGQIERKYLVECTPDLVKKDDDKWSAKLRLHYYWQEGKEYLTFRDQRAFEKTITHGQGDYFIPDNNKSMMHPKVALLDYLGISRLYDDHGFHNEHPVILDIFDKIKAQVHNVQIVAGVDLKKQVKDEKNKISTVQHILALLGHKMVCYSRKGGRGQQIRYYSAPAADFKKDEETKKPILGDNGLPIPEGDGREEVFTKWLERDAESVRKWEQEKELAAKAVQQALEDEKKRIAAAQRAKQIAEAEAQARAEAEREQFLGVVEMLGACENRAMLDDLRAIYSRDLLKAAARQIPAEQRTRLRQWVA